MKLIILDSNSLMNRAFYAMPILTDSMGRATNGIYGFMNMLQKLISDEKPTHICAAFDLKAPTFRHKMYADYKAGRRPMPPELVEQFPLLKELLTKMNIKVVQLEGYEADDILGTISSKFDISTILVSGDRDVLQLVSEKTTVYNTKRGITDIVRYTPQRLAEEGLTPTGVIELKSLMGDHSDNIPGVAGIGEKTAMDLLNQYGDLDGVYGNIDNIKGKLKEKLINNKDQAYMSHTLATINREVPLDLTLDDLKLVMPFPKEAEKMMISMDFKGLVGKFSYEDNYIAENKKNFSTIEIKNDEDFTQAIKNCERTGIISLEIDNNIRFSDSLNDYLCTFEDLFSPFTFDEVIEKLKPILQNPKIKKVFFDSKNQNHYLEEYLDNFLSCDDLQLMLYVMDAGHNWNNATEALKYYGYDGENIASEILALYNETKEKFTTENNKVYYEIELPLVSVLFDMEKVGFAIDTKVLDNLNTKFSQELQEIADNIHSYTDNKTFNINSPKQLAEVLFDELGLPGGKKRSTDVDSLKYFIDKHGIIAPILRYRRLSKLISTYLVGLTSYLKGDDRLHTIFKQALTTTGRLSSTAPNLQNIPVRTDEGKEVRSAFVASKGNKLVVADYSQIELRLLAHFSGDEKLVSDFNSGKDIHTATAAAVFGIPIENVTFDMRRKAKAVNFGIIYGISDFGLSENVGCSIKEAKEFIENYFLTYPTIKSYMDNIKEFAVKNGYVSTFTGRKRYIPELKSTNFNTRSFGERAAMNMPLQGSASDIIKLAMIKVYNRLSKEGLKAKLIMQVHDELVIDTPINEVEQVAKLIKEEMEGVAKLNVPLIAEVGIGDNWLEAK